MAGGWCGRPGATRAPFFHADWASDAGLTRVIDEPTGLVPALPPIWLGWPSVDVLARSGVAGWGEGSKGNAGKASTLAEIYVQAARYEAGMPATLPQLATNDVGTAIAWQIVQSRCRQR
jgi:hypothetical protein